ncbi:MAG: 4-hydroxy-3-methylbut-2-enyl diphosphate reductase, partial [Nanoarchaeota archaeon]|nr:4-hydroxy-3-methylbut-2-enyl diphosphate reductase [Nanoarchaeota archaeon]
NLEIGNPEKLIYLTQTTLSIDDTKKIVDALKQKYPQIKDPPKEDICYATTNRQQAIKELAKKVDLVLVVGSTNSSNSIRLVETAKTTKPAHLVDDVSQIQESWLENIETVGISAGASAPESLVQEIASYFTARGAQKEEFTLMKEDVTFIDPVELRKAKPNANQENQ